MGCSWGGGGRKTAKVLFQQSTLQGLLAPMNDPEMEATAAPLDGRDLRGTAKGIAGRQAAAFILQREEPKPKHSTQARGSRWLAAHALSPLAAGGGAQHSLVPKHDPLDAGAKEHHGADVCDTVKEEAVPEPPPHQTPQ